LLVCQTSITIALQLQDDFVHPFAELILLQASVKPSTPLRFMYHAYFLRSHRYR